MTNNIGNNETLVIDGPSGLVLKRQLRVNSEELISKCHRFAICASRYVFPKVISLIKLVTNRLFFTKGTRIQDGCQCYSTTLWAKKVVTPPLKTIKPMWIELLFPLDWNWHDMDPWLFSNEIRHYLGQTFNARSSGIVELRNHSIHVGGRSPKSIFTLWQLWINICIFFSKVFLIVRTMPRPTPMGIRHEVFALAHEGIKQGAIAALVGLTRATVNRILKRHAATGSLVPGKSSGAPRKTTPRQDRALLRMVWQYRFLSARALRAQMRNLYGMRAGRTTVNNRLLSHGYRAYRPTTKPLLTANHRRLCLEWAQRWWNLTVAHWQHVIFGDESRFQLYPVDGRLRVCRLPGERFRPGCQGHRVQAGGGSVHLLGAFHNSAKSPLVLPDGYLTGVLYRGICKTP